MKHQALGLCPCGAQHSIEEAVELNGAVDTVRVRCILAVSTEAEVTLSVPASELNRWDLLAAADNAYGAGEVLDVVSYEVLS